MAHFDCARASRVLARIQKAEARTPAGLPKLTAGEARAKSADDLARADRSQRRITRLESPDGEARFVKLAAGIEAKCHAAAPGA